MSGAFRPVPKTGVIFVTSEAEHRGYRASDPSWCNLGQGQPETGPLPGAPPRLSSLAISEDAYEYAPVAGLLELRAAVADAYNRRFRRGLPSQYSAENVAICGGGRVALTRIAAALGNINMGHFLPDYTAYEELLSIFKAFIPIPILLDPDLGYQAPLDMVKREIQGRGLKAMLLSNPANPTGQVIDGDRLAQWVQLARNYRCSLILDEFYSHYIYNGDDGRRPTADGGPQGMDGGRPKIVSAASQVEDVDRDPVIIVDGLTKNWRYPGWRISWTLGPKEVIHAIASAGSFLDGGGSRPAQQAAVGLLSDEVIDAETGAIRRAFSKKRDWLVQALQGLGVSVDLAPQGGFYVWGSVERLAPGLDDGMSFFRRALERKVITVPGAFFDINPGHRRTGRASRFSRHLRFSFGPRLEVLEEAVRRFERMLKDEPEPAG
jgi:aspartate/methionine/tyrosine aminotransferase